MQLIIDGKDYGERFFEQNKDKKFGKSGLLSIIEKPFVEIINGHRRWKVKYKCSCGIEKITYFNNLPKLTSCGCQNIQRKSRILNNDIIGRYKILEKISNSCWKCECLKCGLIKNVFKQNILANKYHKYDSCNCQLIINEGFIEGNIQWVDRRFNRMKWDLPQNEFIDLCTIVVEYNKKRQI